MVSLFPRHHGDGAEALQEPPGETTILRQCKEVQGGAEESPGPADGLCHCKTRLEAYAGPQ